MNLLSIGGFTLLLMTMIQFSCGCARHYFDGPELGHVQHGLENAMHHRARGGVHIHANGAHLPRGRTTHAHVHGIDSHFARPAVVGGFRHGLPGGHIHGGHVHHHHGK